MIWYFDIDNTTLLGVGATYKASDGEIYKRELTDDEMYLLNKGAKAEKKEECRLTILSLYSATDQMNVLRAGVQEDIDAMNATIDAILEEYRVKGKDADFSLFKGS